MADNDAFCKVMTDMSQTSNRTEAAETLISQLAPTGTLRAAINMGNFLLVTGHTPSENPRV
jgi:hypothetical protein